MNLEKISHVITLATEPITRHVETEAGANGFFTSGTAATGASRRTSMELTRALANLRRLG